MLAEHALPKSTQNHVNIRTKFNLKKIFVLRRKVSEKENTCYLISVIKGLTLYDPHKICIVCRIYARMYLTGIWARRC